MEGEEDVRYLGWGGAFCTAGKVCVAWICRCCSVWADVCHIGLRGDGDVKTEVSPSDCCDR